MNDAAAARNRLRTLVLPALVLLVAGAAFVLFRQGATPTLAPPASRSRDEAAAPPDGRATPVSADRAATAGESREPSRAGAGAAERARPAAAIAPAPVAPGTTRIHIEGALVDEHARPISEERLRTAVTGELPRIWFTHAGRRLAEFSLNPGGGLHLDVVPPVDRTELCAEITLAGRTFATFLAAELGTPFALRVDLSALALDSSAATIVVRPAPATEEMGDRYVVLFREAQRRATWIDQAGLARFPMLHAGTWEGIVCIAGELPVEFAFTLGERDDRDVLVELRPGFRIRGEAAWSDLVAPLPPCVVIATRLDRAEADADAETDMRRARLQGGVALLGGDGSFELGPLPAGTWRLELQRIDDEPQSLHQEVVTTGGRDVETVAWRITPPQRPARIVRFLLAWPGDLPPEPTGKVVIPRALAVTFFGAGAAVVGRGVLDPIASTTPQLALPDGATVVELKWRDIAGGRLLDSGVAVTRVALPKVVQSGATRDLKVTFAAVPRD